MIGVSNSFHSAAFGQIIQPVLKLYISFNKEIVQGQFFTLGQSELNGPDLLKFAASNADTQSWDFYGYNDYSDRLVSLSWERRLDFPYQVQCGMADFSVANTDGFFTPLNPNSPIGSDNLPARPAKLVAGFRFGNSAELVPQMTGITDGMPVVQPGSKTVDFHMIDFLYDICQQNLKAVINMRDARTDEVIAAILESYGLAPSQYLLDRGRFTIPFVFFDVGDSIGDALKKLVQTENGFLWLNEEGVVRFTSSSSIGSSVGISASLSDYHVVSLESGDLSDIVNHVKITAEVREVQEYQEVYAKTDSSDNVSTGDWVVPGKGTFTISCGLGDPCYDVVAPTQGKASSVSWFIAKNSNGNEISSGVTATGVLSSNAYTITFANTNGFPVEITEMKLWGEPAKVYDVLDYDAYDDESVAKYGDQVLEISDNQLFQSYSQANSFARSLIQERSEYNRVIKASIKGDFSFQLLDLIELSTSNEAYNGVYRVMGISYEYANSRLTTMLTLVGGTKIQSGAFTLNISQLNGEDKIQ